MTDYGLPLAYALFLWWFATGAIFLLNGLPRASFRWSMLAATVVLGLACYGLVVTAGETSVAAAYTAFTCGLVVWGWQTMSYYMGFITGPREAACPRQVSSGQRFLYGVAASLYHELVVAASAVLLVALSWGEPNQIGTWTFLALWGMHLSAKLNVFLGVRNLNEEFLPEHLAYLRSFFRRRAMNPLFPISVTAGTAITALLIEAAVAVEASEFATVGYTLLATLTGLAVLEHWFLILPVPAAALWRWSLRVRGERGLVEAEQPSVGETEPRSRTHSVASPPRPRTDSV